MKLSLDSLSVKQWMYIPLLFLFIVFTRLYRAGEFGFWFDEILTAIDVQRNYKNFFVDPLTSGDYPLWSWDHPPLYFILAKYITLIDHTEFFFRLPPIVFGSAAAIFIYLLARELFGKNLE